MSTKTLYTVGGVVIILVVLFLIAKKTTAAAPYLGPLGPTSNQNVGNDLSLGLGVLSGLQDAFGSNSDSNDPGLDDED